MITPREQQSVGGELTFDLADLLPQRQERAGYGRRHEIWLDLGRSALRIALRAFLGAGAKRRLWLPEFCCPSLLEAALREKFEVRFYADSPLQDYFRPPLPVDGEIVLYIHYFGMHNHAACQWVQSQADRKWFVIEDCVHAALTRDVGLQGDVSMTSLRKFLPLPDGALLSSILPLPTADIGPPNEQAISRKFVGKILRGRGETEAEEYLRLFAEAEDRFGSGEPSRRSWLSEYLHERMNLEAAISARRANWQCLSEWFATINGQEVGITPIFSDLKAGEAPLGFPVSVGRGKRDALRAALAAKRIFCPVHWQWIDVNGMRPTGPAADLASRILTLPVDQHCDKADMSRMIDVIRSFFAHQGGVK